jgi:PqqD family protein of HPr-rel-A system
VTALFSADPADGFKIIPLDGLTALYHRRSGMTHVLAEPAPEIIRALAGHQLDVAALATALGVDCSPDNASALAARLDELCEAGLVSRA